MLKFFYASFISDIVHVATHVTFKNIFGGFHLDRFSMSILRIDNNFCLVHEEITSIRLYTPSNSRYAWVCTA